MKCCKDCCHFTDAHYSKTYISPTCTKFGTDAAAHIRANVCGVDEATFYQPKQPETREGTESDNGSTGRQRELQPKQ